MPEKITKKILLVTRPIAPPWDEGSKNFAFFLAKNMPGFEIHLMTRGTLNDLPPNVRQHPVYTTSEIAKFNLEQKLRSTFFQLKSKGQFDINHYFFTPTALNSFLIKNFLKNKKTKTIQTVATLREDLWSKKDIKKLLFSDLIITYSQYTLEKLRQLGFKNIKRIYPGINLEDYRPKEKKQGILEKYNLSLSDFIINYTGEYVRLGDMDDIIESFIKISEKIPEAKLLLSVRVKNEKDAWKKEEVMKKLKSSGILKKVIFHERGCPMSEIYNLAEISLFPARTMAGKFDVPLAVIEAMACAKPVIMSDLPVLQELSKASDSVIIERGNVRQITEAVLSLYHNPQKREDLGQKAKLFAQKNFDIRKIAGEYRDIYQNL